MTAIAATPAATARPRTARLTLPRIVKSEWIKVRSVRSTWLLLGIFAVCALGITSAMAAFAQFSTPEAGETGVFLGESDASTALLNLATTAVVETAMILVTVFAVLAIGSEYSSGAIRSTLSAAPRRGSVFAAKTFVIAGSAVLVSAVLTVASWAIGAGILSARGLDPVLNSEGVRQMVLGVVYVAVIALIAVGAGFITRSTAGGMAIVLGLLLVLPILLSFLSSTKVGGYLKAALPDQAAGALIAGDDSYLIGGQVGAAAVLASWVVLSLVGAYVTFTRRDA
ncbi:MAG: ABC transporter permease [Bifidobacteriaceae bacterium]|jgi:ABC-2 type transport system permease protein|nr:ABC transporter permease [Bifidobacteriaceae bacterium]